MPGKHPPEMYFQLFSLRVRWQDCVSQSVFWAQGDVTIPNCDLLCVWIYTGFKSLGVNQRMHNISSPFLLILFFFIEICLFYFICAGVFACMSVWAPHVYSVWRPGEGIGSPGAGVKDGNPHMGLGIKPRLSERAACAFNAEPPLQSLVYLSIYLFVCLNSTNPVHSLPASTSWEVGIWV